MLDFTFRRGPIKIREVAFESSFKYRRDCDVTYYHSNENERSYIPQKLHILKQQYTLVTDLKKDLNEIQRGITKNCRYEIRRAEKENVSFEVYEDLEKENILVVIAEFQKAYEEMFKQKGITMKFNYGLVMSALQKKQCIITVSKIQQYKDVAVFHAYLCDENNAMLMYSTSSLYKNNDKKIENCIGRMNKYLHWKDIQWFKNRGTKRFEWGGISSPETPNGIDKFKMEFGGKVACYNNYIIANSIKGKLYVNAIRMRK